MPSLAGAILILPGLAVAFRSPSRSEASAESAQTLRQGEGEDEDLERGETSGRFSGGALVDLNASAQWSPCFFGMCYDSWGAEANRKAGIPGVGGVGSRGCAGWGCPGSSQFMDCIVGPCPKYFGTDTCTGDSGCKSYCDLEHAGSCVYTGPRDQSSWQSWMGEFQQVPLNKLLVVEAHHFLARLGTLDFKIPVQSEREILSHLAPLLEAPGVGDLLSSIYASMLPMWSSCQSSDAAELLDRGVRAFDVRPYLSKSDDRLHDSHGGRGPEVEEAFSQIADFAKNHKSEIVYVNMGGVMTGELECRDCKGPDETFRVINEAVQRHFGECGGGMLLCEVDVTKTVGELVTEGNIIVHTSSWGVHAGSGSPRRIHDGRQMYTNKYYGRNNVTKLKSDILSDTRSAKKAKDSKFLVGHQFILTPETEDFVGSVTQKFTDHYQSGANPHGCQSLACFAEVASAVEFQSIFSTIREKYERSNFLMLDFADREGTMDFILSANRNLAK